MTSEIESIMPAQCNQCVRLWSCAFWAGNRWAFDGISLQEAWAERQELCKVHNMFAWNKILTKYDFESSNSNDDDRME